MARAPAKKENKLPANIDLEADAGAGGEEITTDDMIVPFIKLAQSLNEEIDKNEAKYIDGLEVGMFFNSATEEYFEDGFDFIPAYYTKKYLEWMPNRGGFAGEHGPEILEEATQAEDGWEMYLPNGNEIVPTGTWFGLVLDRKTGVVDQAVIALSKSQLKKSRQLATKIKAVQCDGKNGPFNPAMYYNVLHITSVPESNDSGRWMGWRISLDGNVFDLKNGAELYNTGKMLHEAVKTGAVRSAEPQAEKLDDEVPF